MRRFLDQLYALSGALAAACLAAICITMLAQVVTRELGVLFRGAEDITAWFCAAAAFLALGHTFRRGELVRMGLCIERLSPQRRRVAEITALSVTTAFTGYMLWAATRFVIESWQMNEIAQGLIKVPIWIPQLCFVFGVAVLFVAVIDDFVAVLRGRMPAYRQAEQARRASRDFSETL